MNVPSLFWGACAALFMRARECDVLTNTTSGMLYHKIGSRGRSDTWTAALADSEGDLPDDSRNMVYRMHKAVHTNTPPCNEHAKLIDCGHEDLHTVRGARRRQPRCRPYGMYVSWHMNWDRDYAQFR